MGFISDFIGGITGANKQAQAGVNAAQIQAGAADRGIEAQQQQFNAIIELMKPFVTGGQNAFQAQSNLAGLGGAGAQQQAIDALQNSPQFKAILGQGQNAILQNASATGGLRGGNTQNALAGFSANALNSLIQQQFQNLGGLSGLGQAAASGQAAAGQQTGAGIANLLQQQGAALAGGQIAQGQGARNSFGDLLKIGGVIGGFF